MNENSMKINEKIISVIPAFLLSLVLSSAVFSVYSVPVLSGWSLMILAVTVVMFLICEFVNKHHVIGGIIFTVLVFADLTLFTRLVFFYDWGIGFNTWFFSGAELAETKFRYLLILSISFVPFFACVIYYFTQALYRMSFLTLVSLIPCALSVKVLSEIDNVYVSFIVILNIILLVNNIRSRQNENRNVSGRNVYVLSVAVFMFMVLVISAVIPKEKDARYYDRFEELFLGNNMMPVENDGYSIFSEFSGNADNYRNFRNRRLYTLEGSDPPYFKKQNFDYYDFGNDRWYMEEKYFTPVYSHDEWLTEAYLTNTSMLRNAIISAEKYETGFSEKYKLERLTGFDNYSDDIKQIIVQPENFGAEFFLSPAKAVSVQLSGHNADKQSDIRVTSHGIFKNPEGKHAPNMVYKVQYFDEFEPRIYWCELGGADFSFEENMTMLTELYDILAENNDPLAENVMAVMKKNQKAEEYRKLCEENNALISDEISALAHEITKDLTYDWQKAFALQDYFMKEDYIYNLQYIAEDTSPEYFLFESKTGSCSDFASAYVLLARSVGLTVRYTEGFNPDITSRKNMFVIKDNCSHAYPEVYIANLGWTVFEPTVASEYNTGIEMEENAVEVDYSLVFVLCIISFVGLSVILLLIFVLPLVSEKMFIRAAMKKNSGKCVIMLYRRISSVKAVKIIKKASALTPYEFGAYLEKITGCDISSLVYMVEASCYGREDIPEENRAESLRCYEQATAAIKAYIRNSSREKRRKMR